MEGMILRSNFYTIVPNLHSKNYLLFIINATYKSISGKGDLILVYMDREQLLFERDRLMNRRVISSDLHEIGKIIAVDEDSLIILRDAENKYRIPKSRARAFIDNDLLVDFRLNDLLLIELASLNYVLNLCNCLPKGRRLMPC